MTVGKAWILVALVATLPVGCYATYTGIYWITDAHYPESTEFSDIDLQIGEAIADLGFARQSSENPDSVWFLKVRREPRMSASRLEGSDARMTIAIDRRELSIVIRDLSELDETEFNQAVKDRIEERLESYYGVTGLTFKRQFDILPN